MSETIEQKEPEAPVKDKEQAEPKSNYGAGFKIRMTVLLLLFGLAAAAFYYDKNVLQTNTNKTMDKAMNLVTKPDSGGGVTKKEVAETFGFSPTKTEQRDDYDVETYQFSRALPFAKGQFVTVVYEDSKLITMIPNKEYSLELVKPKIEYNAPDPSTYQGNSPQLGGVPTGNANQDADDDDEDDEDDEEDDSDDSDDGDESADDGDSESADDTEDN